MFRFLIFEIEYSISKICVYLRSSVFHRLCFIVVPELEGVVCRPELRDSTKTRSYGIMPVRASEKRVPPDEWWSRFLCLEIATRSDASAHVFAPVSRGVF